MTATVERTDAAGARPRRPGVGLRLLQTAGWVLIVAGSIVGLYVVYALFFTNLETGAAQDELLAEWDGTVGTPAADGASGADDAPVPGAGPGPGEDADTDPAAADGDPVDAADAPAADAPGTAPDLGAAVAKLEFVRPGSDEAPVRDEPLLVVDDVGWDHLRRGPGHYPATALPGEDGNFAVAGHRTTYGAPFFHLDALAAGDEIHVTDRSGETYVYAFVEQRVVDPTATWVLEPDALGGETPLLTLTTCHPRFSDRHRLVVFAELVS